jgi:hypothetical protein
MSNPVSERLLKVFDYLLHRGTITTKREFAQGCGFPETHFSDYQAGKRNVSVQCLTNLYNIYGVNLTYMVIGKGPIMEDDALKKSAPELAKEIQLRDAKIELLERERAQLLENIAFYQQLLKEKVKEKK